MNVWELNREQLIQLKQDIVVRRNDEVGEGTYMSELVMADEIVSDKEVYDEFGGYYFSEDDFV
jgi:hypothetical protein